VVREQMRPVASAGLMRPSVGAARIEERIPFVFNLHHFVLAYRTLQCRPATGDSHPERTDERYRMYDEPTVTTSTHRRSSRRWSAKLVRRPRSRSSWARLRAPRHQIRKCPRRVSDLPWRVGAAHGRFPAIPASRIGIVTYRSVGSSSVPSGPLRRSL
jgi:hypothetical protein